MIDSMGFSALLRAMLRVAPLFPHLDRRPRRKTEHDDDTDACTAHDEILKQVPHAYLRDG